MNEIEAKMPENQKHDAYDIFRILNEQEGRRKKKKPLRQFHLPHEDLAGRLVFDMEDAEGRPVKYDVYGEYVRQVKTFGRAAKLLEEKTNYLHQVLDGLLHSHDLLKPEDVSWTLKQSPEGGLLIETWPVPKQKGRQRAPVEKKTIKIEDAKLPTTPDFELSDEATEDLGRVSLTKDEMNRIVEIEDPEQRTDAVVEALIAEQEPKPTKRKRRTVFLWGAFFKRLSVEFMPIEFVLNVFQCGMCISACHIPASMSHH
jgi:hypothetical protein